MSSPVNAAHLSPAFSLEIWPCKGIWHLARPVKQLELPVLAIEGLIAWQVCRLSRVQVVPVQTLPQKSEFL